LDVDWIRLAQDRITSCEHENGLLASMTGGKFLVQLREHQLFKDSVSWS